MSNFKKMKLVSEQEDNNQNKILNQILNVLKLSTPAYLKKASLLDNQIQSVLNSDLDEYQKVKLYSNTLIKFLKAKEQSEDKSDQNNQTIIATKALEAPSVQAPILQKLKRKRKAATYKPKIKKKAKIKKEKHIPQENENMSEILYNIPQNVNYTPKKLELSEADLNFFDSYLEQPKSSPVAKIIASTKKALSFPFKQSTKVARTPPRHKTSRAAKTLAFEKTAEIAKQEEQDSDEYPWIDY
jgi:hypothetical protein